MRASMRPERSRPEMSATSVASSGISSPQDDGPFSALNRRAHQIAPLGPAAIVVAHVRMSEQIGEDEPGVAAALADPAVGDDLVLARQPLLLEVDLLELGRSSKLPRLRDDGARPRHALRTGN